MSTLASMVFLNEFHTYILLAFLPVILLLMFIIYGLSFVLPDAIRAFIRGRQERIDSGAYESSTHSLPVDEFDLSEKEKSDFAIATLARNSVEAIALAEHLNDVGIPAEIRNRSQMLDPSNATEVLVPRLLTDHARREIEKFQSQQVSQSDK